MSNVSSPMLLGTVSHTEPRSQEEWGELRIMNVNANQGQCILGKEVCSATNPGTYRNLLSSSETVKP